MLYAIKEGSRVRPETTGDRGECPTCGAATIAKCGELVTPHWAHEARADCDPWAEGETEWHRAWKLYVPEFCREVVIGNHRADVVMGEQIIELQHSPISPAEIREREDFYGCHGTLTWIFDVRGIDERFYTLDCRGWDLADRQWWIATTGECLPGDGWRFMWKHCRRTLWECKARVFLDFGEPATGRPELFRVTRFHRHGVGEGSWVSKDSVLTDVYSQQCTIPLFATPTCREPAIG